MSKAKLRRRAKHGAPINALTSSLVANFCKVAKCGGRIIVDAYVEQGYCVRRSTCGHTPTVTKRIVFVKLETKNK